MTLMLVARSHIVLAAIVVCGVIDFGLGYFRTQSISGAIAYAGFGVPFAALLAYWFTRQDRLRGK